jgi:hypothetical protein
MATNCEDIIIRLADEGVPLAAIKRTLNLPPDQEDIDVRAVCHAAVASGRITAMPAEDWPSLVPRDQRTPSVPAHSLGMDDTQVLMQMSRRLKTSRLESRILLVILRRGHAMREQLHDVVEDNRGNPIDATQQKIIDVIICKLRKKLTLHGLVLHTIHGLGYEMSDADRNKAWAMINGEQE